MSPKMSPNGLGKTAEAFGAGAAAHVGVDAGMAVLGHMRRASRVREHLVRFLGFLELRFGGLVVAIALVAVRVVLHRQLAIGLLDFLFRSVLRHP
jgi:hypothetical protein